MNPLILAPVILAVLFTALLGCLVLGRRLGRRDAARGTDLSGLGAIDGAVFGLLGLLIAFSFSGAATRFDKRRTQIVEEANAIRTAYFRIDVLPQVSQPALRESFRRYVDARLAIYRAIPDEAAVLQATERATAIWDEIWKQALTAGQASPGGRPDPFVLSALNAMFDITPLGHWRARRIRRPSSTSCCSAWPWWLPCWLAMECPPPPPARVASTRSLSRWS